jgi:hypothetical protein
VSPQEPGNIGVEHRRIPVVGETHHRARGIAPDSRKVLQLVQSFRKAAARTVGHLERGGMQPPATDLVAQGIGKGLDVGERRARHGRHRRVAPEELFVHRHDTGDLRLMGKHFADQDRVGITGPPPG